MSDIKQWPEKASDVALSDLVTPFIGVFEHYYQLTPTGRPVPYAYSDFGVGQAADNEFLALLSPSAVHEASPLYDLLEMTVKLGIEDGARSFFKNELKSPGYVLVSDIEFLDLDEPTKSKLSDRMAQLAQKADPVDDNIFGRLEEAVQVCYDLQRQNQTVDCDYDGYQLTYRPIVSGSYNIKEALQADKLAYEEGEQGHSAASEIMFQTFRLGKELAARFMQQDPMVKLFLETRNTILHDPAARAKFISRSMPPKEREILIQSLIEMRP